MHSDEERARCICVWVVTRSVHLLKLLEGYPSMYVMMCSSQVICSFHKEAEAAEGVQACGVEWKLQMPSTSRDIALNRVSHEKMYASYVLRHVGILLEMKGQEYQTVVVDDAAAALNPATDTGAC